jgi:hypothetical protein
VHDLRNENKAFIDSLDIDAQLIRKGKRIASLEDWINFSEVWISQDFRLQFQALIRN